MERSCVLRAWAATTHNNDRSRYGNMIYPLRLFVALIVVAVAKALLLPPRRLTSTAPPAAAVAPSSSSSSSSFPSSSSAPSSSRRYAVPEWLVEGAVAPSEDDGNLITVRFVNTVGGRDVVVKVEPGSNLLAVGDNNGVALPRACRTGLCGSCTCEVKDPEAIKTATNPRDGFATIRACSTKCFVPDGMDEMVVDVYRMRARAEAKVDAAGAGGAGGAAAAAAAYVDPMARFSGNWEKEFRPQWELEKSQLAMMGQGQGQGQVGGASDPRSRSCKKCGGLGRVKCYNCDGSGKVLMGDTASKLFQCPICVGQLSCGCGACRGTGISMKK